MIQFIAPKIKSFRDFSSAYQLNSSPINQGLAAGLTAHSDVARTDDWLAISGELNLALVRRSAGQGQVFETLRGEIAVDVGDVVADAGTVEACREIGFLAVDGEIGWDVLAGVRDDLSGVDSAEEFAGVVVFFHAEGNEAAGVDPTFDAAVHRRLIVAGY